MFDENTVHLRVQASKDHIHQIDVIYGDPFFWRPKEDDPETWEWKAETSETLSLEKEYETQQFDHYFIAVKPQYKRLKYAFIINKRYLYGARGVIDLESTPSAKTDLFNFFNFPYLNKEDLFDAPKWVEDQIWYSIFPERFANGNPDNDPEGTLPWGETESYDNKLRFGGDLEGIIEHLDYIKSLGVTGIYMTPIFDSDSSHKYDINNYKKIDPAFGDNETLGRLVEEAHKRDMKVMLDAVFNHCGFRHPFFQDVLKHGKNSEYFGCFHVINPDKSLLPFDIEPGETLSDKQMTFCREYPDAINYRTFAFTPKMPKLNTDHPLMKEHLLEVAKYWIETYDIDGWRLDVSNEVSHQFWREFRQEVKLVKPDAYIVGENWDNSNPWLQGDQYDAVMNYEILFPIWQYFGVNTDRPNITKTTFIELINKVLTDYPKHVLKYMYNLVDSHDTARIMEICDYDTRRVKMVYLFLFTFPGAPSIYYGGEVGLGGKHDPDNRRCMIWDDTKQDTDLKQFLQQLISIRQENHAFKSVDYIWLKTDNPHILIFRKGDLTFIFNNHEQEQTIALPESLAYKRVKNIFSKQNINLKSTLTISPYQFRVFR